MLNNYQANLYVVSAPSGGGKTSLVRALIESTKHICISISYTTRPKRAQEIEGSSYHFLEESPFQQLISEDAFLEYATVFGHYYGTPLAWVQEKLQQGIDVILEIDWQGQRQIKEKIPNMIGIFLLPPSWETLKTRLVNRAQDSLEVIENRMQQAKQEISHYSAYDYLIINHDFKQALHDLQVIIQSNRLRKNIQIQSLRSLLKDLL